MASINFNPFTGALTYTANTIREGEGIGLDDFNVDSDTLSNNDFLVYESPEWKNKNIETVIDSDYILTKLPEEVTDPTLATQTKTYTVDEQSTLTLSRSPSGNVPVVSVLKEVPQTGVSNNTWKVNKNGADYLIEDQSYDTDILVGAGEFDPSTASYDSVSFDVSSQDSTPTGIAFNNDGTKMYMLGVSSDSVHQYSLSTAFDVSTASYDSVSFDVSSQDSTPAGLAFNTDGTKMYIVGFSSERVYQYSLSNAFDLSTASYDSVSFDVSSQEGSATGIAFNNDGTKMYIVGYSSDNVHQYSLSTAFDVSSASYDSVSFSISSQEGLSRALAFNDDGTKMYVIGTTSVNIHQYSLSTAFDVSSASYESVSFDVSSQDSTPTGIAFNNDGTKMYVIGSASDEVHQYTLGYENERVSLQTGTFSSSDVGKRIVAGEGEVVLTDSDGSFFTISSFDESSYSSEEWSMFDLFTEGEIEVSNSYAPVGFDLSSASYDFVSFSVSSEETSPRALAFNNDGTKMYIVGFSSDRVYQYSLSTAFDVSTASYDSVSFSISSQEGSAAGIAFNTDGTKMYIVGTSSDEVYQYSLSTAFDVSTASYDSVSFDVRSQESSPQGIAFNNDGTKMYIVGTSSDRVYQYSLSTAFDVSTASYDSVSFSISSQESFPQGIAFNNDGTKMYVIGDSSDSIHQYSLSTAFDVSTASYDSVSFTISSEETSPAGIAFNNDGTKMYIVGTSFDRVYQYSTFSLQGLSYSNDYAVAITASGGRIDTAFWIDINSMTAKEVLNSGEVYYAFSTDEKTSWKVISNDNGERSIVRNNAGTWQYNSNSTYTSETWTNSTINNEFASLREAMTVAANQMDSTQLESVEDQNHLVLGDSLNLAVILKAASSSDLPPSFEETVVNYDANVLNQNAVPGTDYNWDAPANDKVRITSFGDYNLKVRVI